MTTLRCMMKSCRFSLSNLPKTFKINFLLRAIFLAKTYLISQCYICIIFEKYFYNFQMAIGAWNKKRRTFALIVLPVDVNRVHLLVGFEHFLYEMNLSETTQLVESIISAFCNSHLKLRVVLCMFNKCF